MFTLASLLRSRGVSPIGARAIRHRLHPQDRSEDVPSLSSLVRHNLLPVYERMQDGRRLGHDNLLISFLPEAGGRARLVGARRVFARRKGVVPGDIVYDPDAAPLLHSFIARARCPTFYDAIDDSSFEDLFGRLVVRWPTPLMVNVRLAEDAGLLIESG